MPSRLGALLLLLVTALSAAPAAASSGSAYLRARPSSAARKLLQSDVVPFISNGQPVPRGQKLYMASLRKSWNGASYGTPLRLGRP